MKKILAIVSMAAMVAGAAFAADVSAKVKIDGSLFNYDGTDFKALEIHHGGESWNPTMAFNFSGEKAGATFKFYDVGLNDDSDTSYWRKGSDTYNVYPFGYSLWFKPVDMFKVTVGYYENQLNQESIDWSNTKTKPTGYGIAADFTLNNFSATAWIIPGIGDNAGIETATQSTKWWFDGENIGHTYFKLGYSADFGTVNGYFNYVAKENMDFGVGYSGAAGSVSYFANAIGFYTTKFASVRFEPFGAYSAGALSVKLWNPIDYSLVADSDALAVNTIIKASYGLGSITPFLYVKVDNWCSSSKKFTVKPGVDGSLGEMSYGVYLEVTIPTAENSKVSVDVPVYFTVSF